MRGRCGLVFSHANHSRSCQTRAALAYTRVVGNAPSKQMGKGGHFPIYKEHFPFVIFHFSFVIETMN